MRLSPLLALMLGIVFMATVNLAAAQGARSRIVNECSDRADCFPKASAVLVVWVVDATSSGIEGVPVEVIRPGRASQSVPVLRTDENGMAVVSIQGGASYRLRINMPGYIPFESDPRAAETAMTKVVTVELRVPPLH